MKNEIIGGKIAATEFYKKERTAVFIFKNKSRTALVFSYHPTRFGAYLIPASKLKISTREKPWPIFGLDGAEILSVKQYGFDRIFKITVNHEGQRKIILFEAIGVNGNIWFLDENHTKLATLRKREIGKSEIYNIEPPEGKLDPNSLDKNILSKAIEKHKKQSLTWFLEKNLLGCNFTLTREITRRASLENVTLDELDEEQLDRLIKTVSQIINAFEIPQNGYLYRVKSKFEAYPFKLTCLDSQPEKYKTLSLAIADQVDRKQDVLEQVDEEKSVMDVLNRNLKKLKKRFDNIEADLKDAADFEKYKKLGELLQINFDKIKKGDSQIEVSDVYSATEETLKIELDPSLAPSENAERYFKKYRKGREGLALIERRREITEGEIAQLQFMISEFESNFESARKKYETELISLHPKNGAKQSLVERLPYKEYYLSTGLKIFVGRDGSDNDRTTFEFTKPYELWFHTQQCPGSHVAIKFPNKNFEPSKLEIEETAAIAAYFSKAKNDSLVPVIYTERKYVRKPRKAKPGLVTVEREKSVMVVPKKPD